MITLHSTTRPVDIYTTNITPGFQDPQRGWVPPSRTRVVASSATCYGFATESDGESTTICAICELPDGRVEATPLKDIKFTDV